MLEFLKTEIYNLVRDLRSVERMINSESFRRAYENANNVEKSALETLIQGAVSPETSLRSTCVRNLRSEIRRLNLAELTIRELKDRAYHLGVRGWSRMDKDTLLYALAARESNGKDSGTGVGDSDGTHRSGDEAVGDSV